MRRSSQKRIIPHEHRDLLVKLEYPQNSSFRLYSPEKRFYDPLRKEQTDERLFALGEDVHLWLSKFHQPKIQLQRKGEDGQWEDYSFIDPAAWDTEDYSALIARPAPIILKVGPPGSPIGTSMKPPKPGGTIAEDYKPKLADYLQSTLDPTATKADFLRQWHTNKFPELELPSNSDPDTQQEPDVSFVFEVTPDSYFFGYDAEGEETLTVKDGLTASDLADAVDKALKKLAAEADKHADGAVATAGQVTAKAQLTQDLMGTKVKITSIAKNGSVKKFVALSGYPGLRKFLTGTRYGIGNPKVVTITAGQMNMGELAAAAGKNVRSLANPTKAGGALVIIGLVVNTWQWFYEGSKDAMRLFAKWTITIVSSVFLAVIEPFVAAIIGAIADFLVAAGVLVATPEAVAVGVVVAVGGAMVYIAIKVSDLMGWTHAEAHLTDLYHKLFGQYRDDLNALPFSTSELQPGDPGFLGAFTPY